MEAAADRLEEEPLVCELEKAKNKARKDAKLKKAA